MKVIALIPAAGMGKRMAAGINKQYLQLNGTPIVAHSIAVFEQSPLVDEIYVISPEEEIPYCREHVIEAFGFVKVRAIVPGGSERQYSVLNGLRAIDSPADDDVILIHDGVRPFVTGEIIEQSIAVALESDGVLVAVPAKDTIKVVVDGFICETPPRETLWQAQTPQSFRYGIIRAAHEQAAADGYLGTDDASLIERSGGKVRVVMGNYRNIKITTPEDLVLAEAFLKATQGARGNIA
jgi:2-C-methyl-D-erythritol 4-phosphate cytidylyltransferase